MQDAIPFVGIDVSGQELSIACTPAVAPRRIANTRAAIKPWLQGLEPGSCVAMESTGRYHQLVAGLALQAGMTVYLLNARDVHHYAKALGQRGKTDALDAQVIARYLAEHHARLHPWVPGTSAQAAVVELLRRRAQTQRHMGAIAQSLQGMSRLRGLRQTLQRVLGDALQEIDRQIKAWIESDERLRQGERRLRTIVGIGPQTAAYLSALFSRIEFANVDAVVAYSGLDPRPNDSGKHRGRRKLTKRGPATLRKLLWLAAFSASHSKVFAAQYQGIVSKGLSSTAATVVLARKLLRIAWAVWRDAKDFDASKVAIQAA